MAVEALPPHPIALRHMDIQDTRTPSPSPVQRTDSTDSMQPPDLSNEVAMLSAKLINAINYQTNLDDSLQQTRHELEQAQSRNKKLQTERAAWDEMITSGALLRKGEVDRTIVQLRAELAQGRAARDIAERAKKKVEGEIENLTVSLFEEANTMVAAARRETQEAERRSSQLKSQLNDVELILASQQEQLQELKTVMEKMSERDDIESQPTARDSNRPTTPVNHTSALLDALQLSPNAPGASEIPPDHPLRFSHILTPVLRSDVQAYIDFQDLLTLARKASSHSRSASQNKPTNGASNSTSSLPFYSAASSSSPNLPGAFSASSSPQSATFSGSLPPLKESKFYKRALTEDIDPTLRLDLAPGLSFLSRRTVLSSLLHGSLIVEPLPPQSRFYGPAFSCALCGESRTNEPYVRKHRFRTSEEESAQRYPLCDYCVNRVRSAGDFVGFLRMVRDGLWRSEREDEQKSAWEESVRLRERMFWARIGGGVVPAVVSRTFDSPRIGGAGASLENIPETSVKTPETAEQQRVEKSSTAEEKREPTEPAGEQALDGADGAETVPAEFVPKDVTPEIAEAPNGSLDEQHLQSSTAQSTASTEPHSAPTTPFEDAETDHCLVEQPEEQPAWLEPASVKAESSNHPAPAQRATEVATEPRAAPSPEPRRSLSPSKRPGAAGSVLERVRNMEQQRQTKQAREKKVPGAFG